MAEVGGDEAGVARLLPQPGGGGVAESVGGHALLEPGPLGGAADDRGEDRRLQPLALEPAEDGRLGGRLSGGRDERAPGAAAARAGFGLESSGWLAYGLARFLVERGEDVRDVRGSLAERERRRLRGAGKSDPRDALAIPRVTAREELPPVRTGAASRELKLLCDYRW